MKQVISGGEKLEAALKAISAKVAKKTSLEVGWFENATYPSNRGSGYVAMIAAIQEFGAPKAHIPPRPFFRTMIKAKSEEWGPRLGAQLKEYNYDARSALDAMGGDIEVDLQQAIIDVNSPALSPVTLMLRKMRSKGGPNFVVTGKTVGEAARRVAAGESTSGVSTKPLIDTSHMLHTISRKVT